MDFERISVKSVQFLTGLMICGIANVLLVLVEAFDFGLLLARSEPRLGRSCLEGLWPIQPEYLYF